MKTVLVFGTFDAIHPGHEYFLQEARKKGDKLVAVVSRDDYVRHLKHRVSRHNEEERMKHLLESGLADKALRSDEQIGTYGVLKEIKPDIICLGHDQTALKHNLEKWMLVNDYHFIVEELSPYKREEFSSSLINGPLYRKKMILFYTLMVIAMGLWGFSWVSAKLISLTTHTSILVFWRFFGSTISFLPLVLLKERKNRPGKGAWPWIILSSFLMFIYSHLFFTGLKTGLASKGGIIVTTLNPLFVFLLASYFAKQKFRWYQGVGLALGCLGGIVLTEPWKYSMEQLLHSGNLLFLAGALIWAGLTFSGQQALKKTPLFTYNFLIYLLATIMNLVPAIQNGLLTKTHYALPFWINVVYLALFSGSLATGIYFYATRSLGSARAGAFTFIVPVSAVFFGWLVLHEHPGWETLVGGIVCLSAVYLINFRPSGAKK